MSDDDRPTCIRGDEVNGYINRKSLLEFRIQFWQVKSLASTKMESKLAATWTHINGIDFGTEINSKLNSKQTESSYSGNENSVPSLNLQ